MFNMIPNAYNIDESWLGTRSFAKKPSVLAGRGSKVPYQISNICSEHVTFTMCSCANGNILPPMITYTKSLPTCDEFHQQGPQNALYNCTPSGHINTDLYLMYVKHLEPYLCKERPVVIFQDNLYCHDSKELVEFCVSKGIHLINFPPKTSHIIQPLDKLFGPLKTKIDAKASQAFQLTKKPVSRVHVPTILRFAMKDISKDSVKESFRVTGVYPFSRDAISSEVLVGDDPPTVCNKPAANSITKPFEYQNVAMPVFNMVVEDDEGTSLDNAFSKNGTADKEVQTDPQVSVSCATCIQNDVSLHPAVKTGLIDIALAECFIDAPQGPENKGPLPKKRRTRDYSGGKWLTSKSEIEKKQIAEAQKVQIEEEKEKKKQSKILEKVSRQQEKERLRVEKKNQGIEKKHLLEMQKECRQQETMQEKGKTSCYICQKIVKKEISVMCILCGNFMHTTCFIAAPEPNICQICLGK